MFCFAHNKKWQLKLHWDPICHILDWLKSKTWQCPLWIKMNKTFSNIDNGNAKC